MKIEIEVEGLPEGHEAKCVRGAIRALFPGTKVIAGRFGHGDPPAKPAEPKKTQDAETNSRRRRR